MVIYLFNFGCICTSYSIKAVPCDRSHMLERISLWLAANDWDHTQPGPNLTQRRRARKVAPTGFGCRSPFGPESARHPRLQ